MSTAKIGFVGLVVADMGASLAFYRRLGAEVPAGAEKEPHVDAVMPGGVRLAWDTYETIRSFDPDWTPGTGGPRVAIAFDCGTPDEVDAVYADLTGAGYDGHLKPWNAFWGQRYASVHDPDGNGVDLYAALPSE